ncbi:hypothetical protein SBDP1_1220011 [Syntrophobacter sp. SbD1]|nr:hypothetical protein SBDP1_1220011 [Syntrophobacter sp. SbD1]
MICSSWQTGYQRRQFWAILALTGILTQARSMDSNSLALVDELSFVKSSQPALLLFTMMSYSIALPGLR